MKQIKNYENYLIRESGIVFNTKLNKYLKIQTDRYGYRIVQLYKNGIPKKFSIHRLIAIQYIINPYNKPEVNHINGIKSDNRVVNLERCTNKENNVHSRLYLNRYSYPLLFGHRLLCCLTPFYGHTTY